MKKYLLLAASVLCLIGKTSAQSYAPIAATGWTLDAVAENTTAAATTGGAIDGSNYVLYSVSYLQAYSGSTSYGLPNNGLIAAGTRTYQLQTYTASNMMYLPGVSADTLVLATPASYPSLSLLGFSTENGTIMNVKVRFTDGSSQSFTNIAVDDWFTVPGTNTVLAGFDRATRNTGIPNYNATSPRLCSFDLNLNCANRLKLVQRIIIQNTVANPRLCIMAVSGALAATYSTSTSPVTCAGGSNGTATLAVSGGVPPFTYMWGTSPVQTTSVANLPAGITSYTVTDPSNCTYTNSVNVSQAIVPNTSITISASQNPICSGSTLTLTTSGAATYTWDSNATSNTTTVVPISNTSYSVIATTSVNCTVTGIISVTTIALPVLTFTSLPSKLCVNAAGVPLTASPSGGTFSGNAITFGTFFPNIAGVGTQTIAYTYSDANNCTSVLTVTTTVSSPTTVIAFSITPNSVCSTAPSITLNATPAGGTYAGTGVTGSAFSPSVAGVGTRTVSYTYIDANNCKASATASVVVKFCSTVGLNELAPNTNYELYPNPNNGAFTIKADKDAELLIINELGQTVQTLKLNGSNNRQVFVENLSSGIYFLSAKDQVLKQKIVVTK